MLKILVALGLGAAVFLAVATFVASEWGGLDRDSVASGTMIQAQPIQLGSVSSLDRGPARLVP